MASGPPRKKARLLQHLGSDEQMSVLALHNPTLVETAASAWSWADPFRTRGFAALMPEILATIYTYLTEQQQFIASAASKHWRLALYHQVRTMAINVRPPTPTHSPPVSLIDLLTSLDFS